MKYIRLVLAWIVCLPFIVIFGVLNWLILPAEAYTRSGSTDPITFTLDQTDFTGGCANGRYGAIAFGTSGGGNQYITPFVLSDGVSTLTFTDVHAADLHRQTSGIPLSLPADVTNANALCSDSGLWNSDDWQSYGLTIDSFIWNSSSSTPETPTSTATGAASEETLDAIAFGIGIIEWSMYFCIALYLFKPNQRYE